MLLIIFLLFFPFFPDAEEGRGLTRFRNRVKDIPYFEAEVEIIHGGPMMNTNNNADQAGGGGAAQPGPQVFSLRWNNHRSHLTNTIDGLLDAELLTDCLLVSGSVTHRVHRLVLAACRYVPISHHHTIMQIRKKLCNPIIPEVQN